MIGREMTRKMYDREGKVKNRKKEKRRKGNP